MMRVTGATAAMILALTLTACSDDGGDGEQATSAPPGSAETKPSAADQGDASATRRRSKRRYKGSSQPRRRMTPRHSLRS